MSGVHTALVPAGTVRMVIVTRAAVRYAAENPEAPGAAGRPVWGAFGDLGVEPTAELLAAENEVTDLLLADDAPKAVALHYFPVAGGLWYCPPGAARATRLTE